MALSNEDKSDVKRAFGKKVAGAVSKATRDLSAPQSYVNSQKHWRERGFRSELDEHVKSKALGKKSDMAKKMRSNSNSEGGIPFGKAPRGEK